MLALIALFVIIAAIIVSADFIIKRLKAKTKPLGDDDYQTTAPAIVPGGQKLTPEEEAYLNKELARANEVMAAQEKIKNASYPVDKTEDFDLILINKTHELSKDYWPEDLVIIDRFVSGVGSEDTHKLRSTAAEALNKMLDAAEAEGLEIRLRTGFRSYGYQASLYQSYVNNQGQEEADTYSARPGFSEHQTGLACDLGGKSENFALSYKFGDTPEGKWVAEHAHEYGFIIRYTDGKTVDGIRKPGEITGYVFEPWHVRYVGSDHAEKIHELGITLEEYLMIVDEAECDNAPAA